MEGAREDLFDGVRDDLTAGLDRSKQTLSVRVERRTYNKPITVIEGFDRDATCFCAARTGPGSTLHPRRLR
ncbi:hypothetical protein ACFQFH_18015 [Halobaculum halobium]|uniref:Uncharacterized protein n=1 Tax=Halobaculum halobium TaxID=3032281 RepID=A0ABD5TJH3_9EURY|nr:hypothetical protein [Halobaculum sp. SYNS20]